MTLSFWQTAASIASDCVLSATLIVFLIQAKTMREQVRHLAEQSMHLAREEDRSAKALRASVYQSLSRLAIEVDGTFLQHPELRAYFYDGISEPSDPTQLSRVVAVAETLIDLMDNFVVQAPHLPDHLSGPWDRYFKDIFGSSPAMQRFWRAHREWYSPTLRELLDPLISPARP